MTRKISKPLKPAVRWTIIGVCLFLLLLVFISQRMNYFGVLMGSSWTSRFPCYTFIFNRTLRFLINDLLCIALIFALFQNRQYLQLAWYVFLIELIIILPLYFYFKLSIEGPSEISSPLLSPVHRIVVNPLLMFTLIAAFYYQRYVSKISPQGRNDAKH